MGRPVLTLAITATRPVQECAAAALKRACDAINAADPYWPLWVALSAAAGLLVTVVGSAAVVYLIGLRRSADYRRFEDANEARIAARFPLASMKDSPSEVLYQLGKVWTARIYDKVNAAQTRYHDTVVRSSACLAIAFFALAFSAISREHWNSPAGVTWPRLEVLLGWIEVWGLLAVLVLFFLGRRSNRPWVNGRAAAELVRQHHFLCILFRSRDPEGTIEDRLGREKQVVDTLIGDVALTDVGERVARYWAERRADLASRPLEDADLSADALLLFLRRRARRQLIWFLDARARLEHVAERRAFVLGLLYGAAFGVALFKLGQVLFHVDTWAPLLPTLLIFTGVSGAMTAYYFNQNARSLIHRYNTQQRFIDNWLIEFKQVWNFADRSRAPPAGAARSDIRARILAFEDLMIGELIDWAHISAHDAIELAP